MYVLKYPHCSKNWARICRPFRKTRIRFPAWQPRTSPPGHIGCMAKRIPWNWFLTSINVYKYGLWHYLFVHGKYLKSGDITLKLLQVLHIYHIMSQCQNFKNLSSLVFYCSFCYNFWSFKSTSGSKYKPAVAGTSMYRWFPVNWAPHTHICLPDFQATAM